MLHALFLALTLLAADPTRNGALPRSTPEAQGVSSTAILDFIAAADREIDAMHSVMIVRHGHVIAEGWWAPYGPEDPHMLYSLSKSFTSTAVGLAIEEGHFGLYDRVIDFFPEDTPAEPSDNLKAMRVVDLLRMATGHQDEPALYAEENWTRAFLHHPVPHRPGTHFQYNTPATFMLSAIVQKTTGQTVMDYLQPRLFAPLGIEGHSWGTNPQGITLGGYGLNIRTEDIAKFGQLYLQKGVWEGRQLLPAAWVDAATRLQVANGSDPSSDWGQGYGYQFWRSRHNTYRGDGAFGQYVLVIPEHDAVIAITSGVRDMQQVMNLVWDKLLPALGGAAPLPESPESHAALQGRLTSLQVAPIAGATSSKLARRLSGKRFVFPANEQGVLAATFDFRAKTPFVQIETAGGINTIPFQYGDWALGETSFASGMEVAWGVDNGPLKVGGSAGWADDATLHLKTVFYETPYYATLTFRFEGDRLTVETERHVSFGALEAAPMVGEAE